MLPEPPTMSPHGNERRNRPHVSQQQAPSLYTKPTPNPRPGLISAPLWQPTNQPDVPGACSLKQGRRCHSKKGKRLPAEFPPSTREVASNYRSWGGEGIVAFAMENEAKGRQAERACRATTAVGTKPLKLQKSGQSAVE